VSDLTESIVMAEALSTPGRPAGWIEEATGFCRAMPDKPLFFSLFIVWVIFFHFLGNSTFGYVDTPSLFDWWLWVNTRGLDDAGAWEAFKRILSADEAYAWFVPFVVMGLLWWNRRALMDLPKQTWWPASVLLVFALLVHILGYIVQQTRVSIVAFFAGLYGLTGLVWGARWLKATFFPHFLFLFCVPMASLSEKIAFPLRLLATWITVGLAQTVLGIDVAQNGTSIWEPTGRYQYEVAAACSGLRSLTAIFALATIYGFIEFKKNWQRLVIMASAFPLAVAGNVVRLAGIIVTAETFGQAAGNSLHESTWFSLLPYVPPIVGLLALGHWLGKGASRAVPLLEARPV